MKTRFLVCALAVSLFAGCGGQRPNYADLNLLNVTGTITLDGKPVPDAIVIFEDVEHGTQSYGITNSSGRYSLMFNSEQSGVMPGEKIVRMGTTIKILGLNSSEGEGESEGETGEEGNSTSPPEGEDLIPEAYRKDSPLRVSVDPSKTTINFDLKSDGSTTGPSD
ncbi:MAG: carboxypeptidase regulatory-like domain-containing protein [Planctomycetaceae bacterium]|nr:carboxypeptidase regulatory-like domain-containing protein [Planctomycetaceae bacterium]